jgi:response regulator RpfG family c-di-GMP phosphodiesterase
MRTTEILRPLHAITVGIVALEFPRREEKYASVLPPDCVSPNLNLPRKDGCALLTEVKVDRVLRKIPIVTFRTPDAQQDILHSSEQEATATSANR